MAKDQSSAGFCTLAKDAIWMSRGLGIDEKLSGWLLLVDICVVAMVLVLLGPYNVPSAE